ncbi:uncharacterized protein F5Z01DRAFT_633926 [Emericellopsis atlantica]|uniref:Uncharacterized protein n=1 Tax=Emericellopsis atlantica TaxID=2614577 RepID=A0A9P8CRL4_9HYPO|nr:uncharacterized protein F5Z01DRAFT_633926 [Emericellopsis atlantica]KAG9257159.1 hypothetical protein F5Z01DRAFT_633926 [Emericellopsis atlantica]
MDPFAKLSQEHILRIFTHLKDFDEAFKAIRASPALFRQTASCVCLHDAFIKRYLPGDTIQDALAIIQFPRQGNHSRAALIQAHLMAWGAHELINPCRIKHPDLAKVRELHGFCRRLRAYINDYLSKATSPHLPWAFHRLPAWSHSYYINVSFVDATQTQGYISAFNADDLSYKTRLKVYKAFMQYEILCKVYGPTSEEPNSPYPGAVALDDSSERPSYLRSWNWKLLSRYRPRDYTLVDVSSLKCVREYIITVYEAMLDHGLPSGKFIGATNENPCRYIDPNAVSVMQDTDDRRMESIFEILSSQHISWMRRGGRSSDYGDWYGILLAFLSSAGFNAVHSMLAMRYGDFKKTIKHLFAEFPEHLPHKGNTTHANGKGVGWEVCEEMRLYRQRAWALLRANERRGPPLPSVEPKEPDVDIDDDSDLTEDDLDSIGDDMDWTEDDMDFTDDEVDFTQDELDSTDDMDFTDENPDSILLMKEQDKSLSKSEWTCHGPDYHPYESLVGKISPFWGPASPSHQQQQQRKVMTSSTGLSFTWYL